MKIVTVVGARPQFVKAAMVSTHIRKEAREILVHTGQHYDVNMSDIFFRELKLPMPDYHLGIGSGSHGAQTGKMLEAIEQVLLKEKPDLLMIYGDTNSTLAGALAAIKLNIPVAHVEAGLRSFNRRMPEEINRVMADHISAFLFAPTETAVKNLSAEGIVKDVYLTGDVMYDAFLTLSKYADEKSDILERLRLTPQKYDLLTLHRAENTDDPDRLANILQTLNGFEQKVIFPIHPRTKAKLKEYGIKINYNSLYLIEPVGYYDMLKLESSAAIIFTDSGGVQKEAFMAKVPCITLRNETEWVETVDTHWNCLAGSDPESIRDAASLQWLGSSHPSLYGDGNAGLKIAQLLASFE